MNEYYRQIGLYLPSYGTIFEPVADVFRAWIRRHRFAQLRDLDDRQLDDIGLSRDELEWGMRLPLRENAAQRVRCRNGTTRRAAPAQK